MLLFRARVVLGSMAMKGAPHSPMLQHYWNLTITLFSVICQTLIERGSYPSAEVQSVYSTPHPVDWASDRNEIINQIIIECSKLAISEDKTRYYWLGNVIHWICARNWNLILRANSMYTKPESALENETH